MAATNAGYPSVRRSPNSPIRRSWRCGKTGAINECRVAAIALATFRPRHPGGLASDRQPPRNQADHGRGPASRRSGQRSVPFAATGQCRQAGVRRFSGSACLFLRLRLRSGIPFLRRSCSSRQLLADRVVRGKARGWRGRASNPSSIPAAVGNRRCNQFRFHHAGSTPGIYKYHLLQQATLPSSNSHHFHFRPDRRITFTPFPPMRAIRLEHSSAWGFEHDRSFPENIQPEVSLCRQTGTRALPLTARLMSYCAAHRQTVPIVLYEIAMPCSERVTRLLSLWYPGQSGCHRNQRRIP